VAGDELLKHGGSGGGPKLLFKFAFRCSVVAGSWIAKIGW
jgi:hypothetical protein